MSRETLDVAILNGLVVDPANDINSDHHIGIKNGVISCVSSVNQTGVIGSATKTIDASGCLVTPGFVDCHVHAYEHGTPLGINVDEYCLRRGVTTVVDAGSAGASTFPGLKRFIIEKSKTRVLCFLHITNHGLASSGCSGGAPGGESDSLNQVDVDACVECVKAHPQDIVGVKVRLAESITNKGQNEQELFRRALRASELTLKPLMVHHAGSTVSNQDEAGKLSCPLSLKKGDILTHMTHAYRSSIIDPHTGMPYEEVQSARRKGVLFDVGHGQGAFNWTVAELCAKHKFWPDIIGSDLHSGNINGPCYDLMTVMAKLHHVGMPLNDVIRAVTQTPASAIGWSSKIGSLSVGVNADIVIWKVEDSDVDLEDCQGQIRRVKKIFSPRLVLKDGERVFPSHYFPFPDPRSQEKAKELFDTAIITDNFKLAC